MIVLDTCALVWWTLAPDKLSSKAVKYLDEVNDNGCIISSISIWEIGIKVKRRTLDIGTTVADYVDRIHRLNVIDIVAVDEEIWLENLALDWTHRDPADRTIIATAKLRNLPIITKDNVISSFYDNTIW